MVMVCNGAATQSHTHHGNIRYGCQVYDKRHGITRDATAIATC